MFKRTGTYLDSQPTPTPTPTQQTLTCALKNAKLMPDGSCCLNNSLQNQLAMCKSSFSCMQYLQQPKQPCLAESKPSCCICLLPPTTLCIVQAFLTGPYLLPQTLSVQIHWVYLEEKLPQMLEEIPLALSRNMWFQHDGAVTHFARQVREHLTATCIDRWTEMGWPVAWPTRSPDLTPMDFFLCGHIKNLILTSPVDSENDLIARIVKAASIITQQPGNS